jgi:uncharacterized membrane protein (UPF0127 family)
MSRRALISFVALLLGGAACSASASGASPTPTGSFDAIRISHDGASSTLHVAVADTDEERANGLMHATHLPADRGMAFVFPTPTTATFWMKDTLIPLSIAFVADGRVVALREMMPCTSDPCATYDAGGTPYTLAIEANAGYFRSSGIAPGDRVQTERTDG